MARFYLGRCVEEGGCQNKFGHLAEKADFIQVISSLDGNSIMLTLAISLCVRLKLNSLTNAGSNATEESKEVGLGCAEFFESRAREHLDRRCSVLLSCLNYFVFMETLSRRLI